jgi:hypothetical protein
MATAVRCDQSSDGIQRRLLKPLCKILDTQFTLVLANAQHIKNVPGRIQVADICTNIFYRYFRKDPDIRAYDVLKSRVVGRDGYLIRMITVAERSLHKDDLSNHVSAFDMDEWKRLTEVRRGMLNSAIF